MVDWLNPRWQKTYVIPVPLAPKFITARFETETSARVSRSPDGRLRVTRQGRYLGGYLRTVATLTPNESNTEVSVTFSRPKATIWLMFGFAVLAIAVSIAESVPLAGQVLSGVWKWSNLATLLPIVAIGVIFAVNHSSAMGDAEYLYAEIRAALTQPPRNFWRALAQQSR